LSAKLVPTFADRGVAWSEQRIPAAVNLRFQDRFNLVIIGKNNDIYTEIYMRFFEYLEYISLNIQEGEDVLEGSFKEIRNTHFIGNNTFPNILRCSE
jgi:hypothetical protein